MYCDVIEVSGGFVVRCTEGRHVAYLGRDGYWARQLHNAVPFSTVAEAEAYV